MKKQKLLICSMLALAALLVACDGGQSHTVSTPSSESSASVGASAWEPDGVVEVLVPSKAGGGHDTATRALMQCIENTTGVRANISNYDQSAVAFTEMANADPDGLIIGIGGSNIFSDTYNNPDATYNSESYRYICTINSDGSALCVRSDSLYADSLDSFIAYAKENTVNLALSGTWQQADHCRWMLQKETGVQFNRVSIKGGANCLLAVVAGDVDTCFCTTAEAAAYAAEGTVKVLGITDDKQEVVA